MIEEDIRKELIKGTIEEFRGPRYGHDEIISYDPLDEYLISTVIPSSWKQKAELNSPDYEFLDESDYNPSVDSSNDEVNVVFDNASMLNPSSQIKSFGLSFLVDSHNPEVDICVTWGRYIIDNKSKEANSLNEDIVKSNGKSIFWKRISYEIIKKSLKLNYYENGGYLTIYDSDDGKIRLYIKCNYINDEDAHISIYFRNDLILSETTNNNFRPETQDCIFQPSIRILFNNCQLTGMNTSIKSTDELDFLYKNKKVFASGHLCSVIWKDIDYFEEFKDMGGLIWPDYCPDKNKNLSKFTTPDVRTEFIPMYPINLPSFDLKDKISDLELKAIELSDFSQNQLYENFSKLLNAYSGWISSNERIANDLFNAGNISDQEYELIYCDDCLICKQKSALNRMKKGVELIKSEKLVYLSFCFANRTIALQDQWKKNLSKNPEIFSWRPFQIAFMLLNIESICNDGSNDKDMLDLLWIPTGGGKTEAYLGIMAFTMALRRLKSYYGLYDEKTGAGVSIISRYTLRLLTVQQFRRTLRMVTAAEYLRVYECGDGIVGWRPKNCNITDNWIYGSVRFSVGMWVGGAVTPLHLNYNKKGAMDILNELNSPDAQGNPSQIIKCPVCGSWLYVPDEGLTDDKNKIHVVIKTVMSKNEIKDEISLIEKEDFIDGEILVSSKNNRNNYYTLSFDFNRKITKEEYKRIINNLISSSFEIASLNKYSVGYFGSRKSPKNSNVFTDFEIWCTNPECKLNHFWKEGSPENNGKYRFPDNNYEKDIISPFIYGNKIPIPAYLIDEHVYYRCPTIIVSTADKIARLAFEPRAGTIFGNVDFYNDYYGYCREDLFPKNELKEMIANDNNFSIKPFLAPDLIIQDELHLMDGPLGSLFGLYEVMVNALIKKQGGNPKYIASTATINNAKEQVKLLFSKDVSQFPPYGLNIDNSFFVRESIVNIWKGTNRGRVYMGIYAPGMGAFTHQIRLYCRLMKVSQDLLQSYNENKSYGDINSYWTITGYYNTLRELGSALALYRDDMHARIEHISPKNNIREIKQYGDSVELSSRIDSTDLPILLDNLENDGKNDPPEYNALFTTSMFGTGVDIPHLSTMVMNAQPKTTGDYIQATGRIGRKNGGLIIDLFRSGRPRDLNHYELFSSYHSKIYREVEPVSVSPFSEGCLDKGLGPSFVAFLRNSRGINGNWTDESDAKDISTDESKEDILFYRNFLESHLKKIKFNDKKIDKVLEKFDDLVDKWKNVAEKSDILYFVEYLYKIGKNSEPQHDVVLGDPIHEKSNRLTVYKNAPQSLRDVEDTLGFWV